MRICAQIAALMFAVTGTALAQNYPEKLVSIIVPFAAGGSTDVGIASTVFAARDLDYGIVVARDACYSTRGPNNDFFMERVFPRMARVMSVDAAVALMVA